MDAPRSWSKVCARCLKQPAAGARHARRRRDEGRCAQAHRLVVGVHNVSFDVQEGEIFVLMGLSGSGKSTLIRLVNRLVDPSAGKVMIDGPTSRRRVARR